MKKIFLSLAALLSVTLAGAQELAGYKAVTSSYLPATGTVVNSGISTSDLPGMSILSDATGKQNATTTGKGFAIGFDFPFNGKTMKYFGIGANGLVKLSETEDVTMQSANNPHFATSDNGGDNTIFFYDSWAKSYAAADGDTTTVSYIASADQLTVQFKNLGINTSSWSTKLVGTYTVQIVLKKDGTIQYQVFGLQNLEATNAGNVFMGIRGDYEQYLLWKSIEANETSWADGISAFKLAKVENGYTVTLNTPADVVAPTAQPTDMVLSAEYNNDFNGGVKVQAGVKFTNAEGVDKYLVLGSEGAPTELPVDGTEYEKGSTLGNATVMLAGPQGSNYAWLTDMKHDTKYTFTVYAYNSYGKGGAKYNTVDPLTYEFTTAPEAPKSFAVKSSSQSGVSFSVTPNAANEKIFVVYNDSTYNPENRGSIAYTGTPDASKKAGDELYDGEVPAGKVAYFGPAADFTVEGLDASTSYYFTAYSYNETTGLFSQGYDRNVASVGASTNIVAPYTMNCAKGPESYAMGGWTVSPAQTDMGIGFNVPSVGDASVTPQVEETRHWECAHTAWDDENTNTVISPVIELADKDSISMDIHMHTKGSGWFARAAAYDEWEEGDYLEFFLMVDGQKIVLEKYTSENAFTANDEDAETWHAWKKDLSSFQEMNVQFGITWHCEKSGNVWFSFEDLSLFPVSSTTNVKGLSQDSSSNSALYNLAGQKVNKTSRGVLIQDSKKFVNK